MSAFFSISMIMVLSFLGLVSCSSERNKLNERFKMSTKRAEFSAQEDSVIIVTEGEKWWINDVDIDGTRFYASAEDYEKDFMQIEGEWFVVKKQGQDKLIVKVSENNSKDKRELVITLESGNYFDCIDVLQKGKEEK